MQQYSAIEKNRSGPALPPLAIEAVAPGQRPSRRSRALSGVSALAVALLVGAAVLTAAPSWEPLSSGAHATGGGTGGEGGEGGHGGDGDGDGDQGGDGDGEGDGPDPGDSGGIGPAGEPQADANDPDCTAWLATDEPCLTDERPQLGEQEGRAPVPR